MANCALVECAVTFDEWVDARVVEVGGVGGCAAAWFAADIPGRCGLPSPSSKDRVQRFNCKNAHLHRLVLFYNDMLTCIRICWIFSSCTFFLEISDFIFICLKVIVASENINCFSYGIWFWCIWYHQIDGLQFVFKW